MKKQVIVLAFNGDRQNSENKDPTGLIFPGLSLHRNVGDATICQTSYLEKSPNTKFVPFNQGNQRRKMNFTVFQGENREENKFNSLKQEQNESHEQGNQRVELDKVNGKTQRRKKNKNKTDFQIKNVLQQISSSIQSCVKDGYVPSLTQPYLLDLQHKIDENKMLQYKKNMARMHFLLDNPTQYNFGCLLKMGEQIHDGLELIFKSKILKKYIQCSKIRTLKQKSICLEAVDYLYRCFKQQQICSLHTWAHKRQEKLQNKIIRLKSRAQKNRLI